MLLRNSMLARASATGLGVINDSSSPKHLDQVP